MGSPATSTWRGRGYGRKTRRTSHPTRLVDSDPVRGGLRVLLRDGVVVRRLVQVLRAGDADIRSIGSGDGDQRQSQDAWRSGRSGRGDQPGQEQRELEA